MQDTDAVNVGMTTMPINNIPINYNELTSSYLHIIPTCQYCGRQFRSGRGRWMHMKRQHEKEIKRY